MDQNSSKMNKSVDTDNIQLPDLCQETEIMQKTIINNDLHICITDRLEKMLCDTTKVRFI